MNRIDLRGQLPGQPNPGNRLLKSSRLILPSNNNPLSWFSSLTLEELGPDSLQDRQETKYLMPSGKMQLLLDGLETAYWALEIKNRRSFDYLSVYFDTPDRLFYKQHQAGALPRWKIRQRTYLNSGISYLEVKYKDNRGVTHKARQQTNYPINRISKGVGLFLQSHYPGRIENLKPVLETRYNRITLVRKTRGERITLDSHLRFSEGATSHSLSNLVVAEIKQANLNPGSPFISQLKQIGIRPGSFSKYCIGSLLLNPDLKYNRFKPIVHLISSLTEGGQSNEWAL